MVKKANQPPDPRIAAELRDLRNASGQSQAQLAARLGVDRTTISRIEKGKRRTTPEQYLAWHAACGAILTRTEVTGANYAAELAAILSSLDEVKRQEGLRILRVWGRRDLPDWLRQRILGNIEALED